jgi:hypothetical protein
MCKVKYIIQADNLGLPIYAYYSWDLASNAELDTSLNIMKDWKTIMNKGSKVKSKIEV